ncbi:esterase-like activity of phytase family protein [Chitinimonas sp. BJYL2]|uniref:esterase-like activity of phytase family protein n=1 Tax=Chitinimonas sp. BJYL2 TaxID=2976696 RepID=UPI0022B3D455|nr:esterase-like activity of phytase family protein [Chitinimonas sp. BJYL2]
MQVRLIAAAVAAGLFSLAHAAEPFEIQPVEHALVATVERYSVAVPASEYLPYKGKFQSAFPQGLHPAYGSGLRFKGYQKDGSLDFWAVTDRGPNGDAPKFKSGDKASPAKVFLSPDFAPRIGLINVQLAEVAKLTKSMPLTQNGNPISGRPISPENTGSSKEVPLSDELKILKFDDFGMDPEGIDFDAQGNLWISDEYGPFIAQVDAKSGEFMQQYMPGAGLPDVLGERQPNRGMEGIAVTPKGLVVGLIQSTLDIKKETKGTAQFIRLVTLDPKTGKTQMFAYPHDVSEYKKSGDAKMGDIVAIDETRFLVIEQGKDKNKKMRNVVYLIDIKGADELSDKKLANGKPLEYGDAKALAELAAGGGVTGSSNLVSAGAPASLKMAKKTKLFDLRDLGWTAEKAEGLAIVGDAGKFGDSTEIAIINDNDFGLKGSITAKEDDPEEYVVDKDGKLADAKGNAVSASYVVGQGEERDTQLWLIHLKQPLKDFYPK